MKASTKMTDEDPADCVEMTSVLYVRPVGELGRLQLLYWTISGTAASSQK